MSSNKIETRSHILETALSLLEEQRGHGVRMTDIAKRANLSRQAIYLHFDSRAELMSAATSFLDEKLDLDRRLAPSRTAKTGFTRLKSYIHFWGYYIPEIYGVAKALLLIQDTDKAAAAAWNGRMFALRDGCEAVIEMLHSEGRLIDELDKDGAIDFLWTLLSISNWENLTIECGWSTQEYIDRLTLIAERTLVRDH